tara:strand:- start:76 stop:312 length:237 start_codon:yes stop_codon:yes gene_type:complete
MSDATYYAQIDENNLVVSVAVVTAEFMAENPDRYQGEWVETFLDVAGKTYAGVGYLYDPATQDFSLPIYEEPLPIDPA